MGKRTPPRRILAALLTVGVLLAVTAIPANAGVTDNKTYTVTVTSGAAYAGDGASAITIALKNTSPSQQLGSANITVPSPLSLLSATSSKGTASKLGSVIQLRNLALAPTNTAIVNLVVDVPCSSTTPLSFSATAKQSNDYLGTGNDFFPNPNPAALNVTAPCKLVFSTQPTDAEKSATITGTPFDPNGAAIGVEVRDGSGTKLATSSTAPRTATVMVASSRVGTLAGTASVAAVAGLATFPDLRVTASAFDYTLTASSTSPSLASATSNSFDIVDDHANCLAGQACGSANGTANNGATVKATFGAGGTLTNLLVSIGAADAPTFECAGYPRSGLQVSQFSFSGDAGGRTGTMEASIPNATKPLNDYEVCWAAPYTFTVKPGTQISEQGTKPVTGETLHVGLLPDCPKKSVAPAGAPCIESKTYTKSTKTVAITVRVTGDDPWRY